MLIALTKICSYYRLINALFLLALVYPRCGPDYKYFSRTQKTCTHLIILKWSYSDTFRASSDYISSSPKPQCAVLGEKRKKLPMNQQWVTHKDYKDKFGWQKLQVSVLGGTKEIGKSNKKVWLNQSYYYLNLKASSDFSKYLVMWIIKTFFCAVKSCF